MAKLSLNLTDKLQKVPPKTRSIAFGIFIGILVVLYIWQLYLPNKATIEQLQKSVSTLQAKIQENDAKIRKLDELKAEVKALEARLAILTEQLPPESEVSGLLRQIQKLVNASGLTTRHWKPDKGKPHSSGLYVEIPILVELTGGYHDTAVLFDRVSKLTRIVNIQNIKMGNAKMTTSGAVEIQISCTAMTFAAVEKKVEAASPAGKKTQ
ncbi:MAG TPA: type 4a pilus biogenesis protein PilO [Nitrospirota bacterium]